MKLKLCFEIIYGNVPSQMHIPKLYSFIDIRLNHHTGIPSSSINVLMHVRCVGTCRWEDVHAYFDREQNQRENERQTV